MLDTYDEVHSRARASDSNVASLVEGSRCWLHQSTHPRFLARLARAAGRGRPCSKFESGLVDRSNLLTRHLPSMSASCSATKQTNAHRVTNVAATRLDELETWACHTFGIALCHNQSPQIPPKECQNKHINREPCPSHFKSWQQLVIDPPRTLAFESRLLVDMACGFDAQVQSNAPGLFN